MNAPYLIVGQGLAGSALAWHLLHAGARCLVVDRPLAETASRVAAGLVNPLLGRKIKPDWRQEECLPFAHDYYRATEKELKGSWWQCTQIWRELADDDQEAFWQSRQTEEASREFAGPLLPWPTGWQGQGAAAITYGAAVLHAELLVNAQRAWLQEQGAFVEGEVLPAELEELADGGIAWRGESFKAVIWSNGFEAAAQLGLEWLESRLSQGAIVDLELPQFDAPEAVLHFGHWLVRHGDCWRLGATYDWLWSAPGEPSPTALDELLHDLSQHWQGGVSVRRVRAAVRPIIRYSQPLAGPLPEQPGQYLLGGLGSRGCTTAPWVAAELCAHLLQGHELPADLVPATLEAQYRKRQARMK